MFSKADLTSCRRCHRTVRWTTSEAGKAFAVDPDPNEQGTTAVMRDVRGTLRSRRVSADRPLIPGERLMMPHAATCTPPARGATPPPRTPPRRAQPRANTFYAVLGVSRTADAMEIRSAYRRLARQLHPDTNPGAGDRFKAVTEAYAVLSDPTRRQVYDLTGRAPRPR
ncbi:J domain-containing protein [Streptosporangium sp. NPDC006007]|uniref:J domain-containing protein n=1 Tax=Streptosporangium sp. NPDC006007 TaxID=3154575 RepID=UPI0033AF2B23